MYSWSHQLLPHSGNVWWNDSFQAFGERKWWINRPAKRLIVSTNLDAFSLANHEWFPAIWYNLIINKATSNSIVLLPVEWEWGQYASIVLGIIAIGGCWDVGIIGQILIYACTLHLVSIL